jgi:hypothetical protein
MELVSETRFQLVQVLDWIVDDVTGDLLLGQCERLSSGSQIIPTRSAATTATPIAGSASESKKTISTILATKIQKLTARERTPRCDR